MTNNWISYIYSVHISQYGAAGEAIYGGSRRELDGENVTSTSITGSVTIAGYPGGIDPKTGAVNDTLWVEYDLQGCNGTCALLEVEDNLNFCEEVAIGELDPDNSAGDVDVVKKVNPTATDVETTDVDTTINQLFDRPMVVQDADGRVLACAMFKEIVNSNTTNSEGEVPMDKSGAIMSSASTAWVFFIASTMMIADAVF
jgi:hypothetical protein